MALKNELLERGPGATQAVEARYYNRELSWLEFNARVLALAENEDLPLLERVKFLAIFTSNLDEFFQIRVSGIREQVAAGVARPSPDGMLPLETLDMIRERVRTLCAKRGRILAKLLPVLGSEDIVITDWDDLSKSDRHDLSRYFEEHVFPILTPLAVDPAHPFPYISNLSLNLAVVVRDPKTKARRFARVKVPNSLPRFVMLEDGKTFVPLEQIVAAHTHELFPGMEIVTIHPFRVARDADVEVEVAEADDLLSAIQEGLRRRERSPEAVQLEVDAGMPRSVTALLMEELDLTSADVYPTKPLLNVGDLMELTKLDRPDLKLEPWIGVTQRMLAPAVGGQRDIFSILRDGDILVQHPYDSFDTSVAMFISEAARDSKVLAIKQTLYRTSVDDSPIVRALVRAAAAGKQAVAMIELTARFDEEANIGWARMLEEAGVHVVYGVVGLKTHAKSTLVVREEGGGIRRYCHLGTGNYHPGTATLYEDIGLFTADPDIGSDVSDLFNYITGYSRQDDYRTVLVAPLSLRSQLMEMIRHEEKKGRKGRIVMKMNSLVDPQMIEALYSASRAGVPIDLIVRGICCLKAREPGLSDNIRVRSIVGRFLEHSRIFRFGADDAEEPPRYFIGSADLMPRNLDHRVECVTPVKDPELAERLEEILRVNLTDDVLAWELGPRGWSKVHTRKGIDTHVTLERIAKGRNGWSARP
jgi:polyphosphate kinase